ncbi:hypothetical protein ACFWG0_13700 [Streptomyces yangpuensis]|uniref:hypothetical protein n=1 Tax=Streptomyces yangpuensis TaxID=1648182 RepID=UPI0036594004
MEAEECSASAVRPCSRRGRLSLIHRTHKHKWSEQRGNRDVYAPDDIRHTPDPIADATLTSMDEEYDRVVRDFVQECRMDISAGYVWVPPTPPLQAPTLEGFEEYP